MKNGNTNACDNNQFRQYNLNLSTVPRLHYENPEIDEYIEQNKPVIITESNMVKTAVNKWTLEYFETNLAHSHQTVYASNTHNFKYFDEKKIYSNANTKGVEFSPQMRKIETTISEFLSKLRNWKEGEDRLYLQQSLTTTLNENIAEDFIHFDWNYINGKRTKHKWGPLTSNLLFISMEGNVTPCHYDEQENFFAQVQGHKRCILFAPDQFECLYPYPVYHPHDRQSMVDFDQPDYNKFPKYKDIKGFEAMLSPGDVLYIPIYWWHHVESLMKGGPTITVNFWYKGGPTSIDYPLKDHQKVSIMRNVEKMMLEVLQDPNEVGPLLRAMVLGRYTE